MHFLPQNSFYFLLLVPLVLLDIDGQDIAEVSHSPFLHVVFDSILACPSLIELIEEYGGCDSFGEERLSNFVIGEDHYSSAVNHLQDFLYFLVEHIF